MRLLNVHSLEFEDFHRDVPKYVTASHRWSAGNEAMIGDIKSMHNTETSGFQKVEGFARFVREHISNVDWLWIDTCCVNQDSSKEVDEAVNSMFQWYSDAEVCLTYLADVSDEKNMDQFRRSEWFRRGWTLQELIAPAFVVFLSKYWQVIGCKGEDKYAKSELNGLKGSGLEQTVAAITGIPECVLHDYQQSKKYTTEEKLAWIVGRDTTKSEDIYYSMLGLFEVRMSLSYGEGAMRARQRLIRKIWKRDQEEGQFKKIKAWLLPPDPWTNHVAARQRHEPYTGSWLLQSEQYQRWKAGNITHLWLYGKAGCGKTVLCSTVVEDIRMYCESRENATYGIFYFTFSDNQKQSYKNLLRSLAAQLGWQEPALSMLTQACEEPNASIPGVDELEKILLACSQSHGELFLLLDALDECPEGSEVRQNVLDGLEHWAAQAPNVRIFVTSREVSDVGESMETLGADLISVSARSVDTDIQRYISSQLSRDRKLSKLDKTTKKLIEDTISRRANGMFRWAYCQLQELKMLKSTKPKYLKEALLALPSTLDETYERMLTGIDQMFRKEAIILLQWLAYARSPLTLAELAEASIIDVADEGTVDFDNRGSVQDTLEILAGLVTCDNADDDDIFRYRDNDYRACGGKGEKEGDDSIPERPYCNEIYTTWSGRKIGSGSRVRLAHFSVQEYLESKRILESAAKDFYLTRNREHRTLVQSCLIYLTHYSMSSDKSLTEDDLEAFPLLQYAAQSWYYHSSLQQAGEVTRETSFLSSRRIMQDWLLVHQPDYRRNRSFELFKSNGSGLYYASVVGLEAVVCELLGRGLDTEIEGGRFGNALAAASAIGHTKIMQILIEAGADIHAQGGSTGNALQAASEAGHKEAVQMLINTGVNVNTQGGLYGNALQASSFKGHRTVVQTLINAGANILARGGQYGSALQAASAGGFEKTAQMLLDAGADINAQGGLYGNALQAASARGYEKIMHMLINIGADVHARGGYFGNALQAASAGGYTKIVQMLLNMGADVHARGGYFGNALQAASAGNHTKVVKALIGQGAIPNAVADMLGRSLIHLSASSNFCDGIELAIANGHAINKADNQGWTALHWAAYFGNSRIVRLLLQHGAKHICQDWQDRMPIQVANLAGHRKVMKALAEMDQRDEMYDVDPVTVSHSAICDSCCNVSQRSLPETVDTCPHSKHC